MSKTFTIFNQRLAGWLMQRGFVLIDIAVAKDDSGRNVFFFSNTPALHEAIHDYKKSS